jgi:hypothetical protein
MKQLGLTGEIFVKFGIGEFLKNMSGKFKFCCNLTSIMVILHKDLCIFLVISRSFPLRMKNVSDNVYRENQNKHFVPYFLKVCHLRDNVEI